MFDVIMVTKDNTIHNCKSASSVFFINRNNDNNTKLILTLNDKFPNYKKRKQNITKHFKSRKLSN
jgi:hypothetical protein